MQADSFTVRDYSVGPQPFLPYLHTFVSVLLACGGSITLLVTRAGYGWSLQEQTVSVCDGDGTVTLL